LGRGESEAHFINHLSPLMSGNSSLAGLEFSATCLTLTLP
jgi:hypothetical protein